MNGSPARAGKRSATPSMFSPWHDAHCSPYNAAPRLACSAVYTPSASDVAWAPRMALKPAATASRAHVAIAIVKVLVMGSPILPRFSPGFEDVGTLAEEDFGALHQGFGERGMGVN